MKRFSQAILVLAAVSAALPAPQKAPAATAAGSFSAQIVAAHNKYRAAAGLPPLVWSDALARAAQSWATELSLRLQFAHDRSVSNQGENLGMGTSGSFTLVDMIDAWGREQRYFRNGNFPDVSTTGNWSDVGHYTQMVWRETRSVGCAGVTGADGYYRLVCRYSPPGNVIGERVY